jgi:hypothetical protein
MPNDSTPQQADSAFALRNALKQTQSQVAQDRLFEHLGQQLFNTGWSHSNMQGP